MVGGAIMGGGGGGQQEAAPAAAQPQQPMAYDQNQYPQYQQPQQGAGPVCQFEMKQFLECAQTQHDITLCQGFNEALRQCKQANGEHLLLSQPNTSGNFYLFKISAQFKENVRLGILF